MNTVKIALTILLVASIGTIKAQSFKEKMKAKIEAAKAATQNLTSGEGSSGKYKKYKFEDPSGISGTYFLNAQIQKGYNTLGLDFTKEKDGEIVNKLKVVFGGKSYGDDRAANISCVLKEKYKRKHNFNHFTIYDMDAIFLANHSDNITLTEIGKNIYAYAQQGTVIAVAAKDSANFADYDIETGQVLYDQKMATANREAMDKETAKWKRNEIYANNINKIVFATEDWHLMTRGTSDQVPKVNGKGFLTQLDMAENMYYMAFFEYPPKDAYPGQEVNIEYEMNGKKTNRVECRNRSAAWGKMVPRIETKKFDDRQHAPRPLRAFDSYYKSYIQDYAFIQLLYMNKGQFKIGSTYTLKMKMYVNRDGENGDLIGEGTVKLLYSANAHKEFNGDPNSQKTPVWTLFEDFLDE
jgi:hypothetical protein